MERGSFFVWDPYLGGRLVTAEARDGISRLAVRCIAVPTPFPIGDVNAYLVEADPLTLVDCGPLTDEAWAALVVGVERAGLRLEEVQRLVLTHAHHDHSGLAERVRRISGCRVYAHPADHGRLLDVPGEGATSDSFEAELCRRAGAPRSHVVAVAKESASRRRYGEPLVALEALDEGDELVAEREGEKAILSVLHTPGHARGALCLWAAATGELLSGDTLLSRISSKALAEPAPERFRQETLPQYLRTLQRLASLATSRAFPGHGPLIERDVKSVVERRLKFHERRAARILGAVCEGLRTPWQIADRLFPRLPASAVYLAVNEVVGHLDLLSDRGEIVFEGQDGGWEVTPA